MEQAGEESRKGLPAEFAAWVRGWYPEIQLGVLVWLVLSLAFPPFAKDASPGQTDFLGWHSLFTQSEGYISLSRLVVFWLLTLAVAACVQLSGERCSRDSKPGPATFFGAQASGGSLFSGTALLAVLVAIPTWLFLCGLVVGRTRILGLEGQLGYLACVAFQLIVLSRALLWLSRDRTNLQFGYLILGALSLAWDLRTSPSPEGRVGGLVPLYMLLGYLLYRFDLRFVDAAPAKPVVKARAVVQETEPVVAPAEILTPEPMTLPEPDLEPEPELEAEAEPEPEPEPIQEPVPQQPAPQTQPPNEDPYQRYRPKR